MAYLGNTPQTQSFTPAIDYFNGTGATTAFTLSRPVASVAQVQVVIENVPQNPSSAYTVSGQTITFTSAPPSGTNNIYVEYTSPITQYNALSQSPVVYGDLNFGSTGARIQGDFSNATQSNRVAFQTSTANNSTNLQVIPNGTSQQSAIDLNGSSALTNQARFTIRLQSDEATIRSAIDGTGTYLPMTFYTGGSERMRIDSSGNVGIGTSSPNSYGAGYTTLQVNGSTSGIIQATSGGTSYIAEMGIGNNLGYFGTRTNQGVYFKTNDLERMRIDSSGIVYINGTTGYGSAPSGLGIRSITTNWQVISLSQPNSGGACFINYATTSTAGIGWDAGAGASTTYWQWRYNTANVSNINPATGAYSATSDLRVKENIADYSNALTAINLLRPVTYNFIKDEAKRNQIGLIAQEVVDIIPEIVEKPATDDDYYSLNYAGLAPVLVKAIQEQQELIKQLQADVAALKGK